MLGDLSGVRNLGAIGVLSKVEGHLLHTPLDHNIQKKHETMFLKVMGCKKLYSRLKYRASREVPGDLSGVRN